jgi:mono/diheme cytochrome c family protein
MSERRSCHASRNTGGQEETMRIIRRVTHFVKVPAAVSLAFLAMLVTVRPAAAADGWFTQAQATRGHQLFNNQCAQCHRPDLAGAVGPALVGPSFLAKWGNKPLSDLYTFEHTKMPATNPGSVPPDQLWAITAYILQKNGFTAGGSDLGDAASSRLLASK